MEIANVAGEAGLKEMLKSLERMPCRMLIEVSSRVPTAPGLETTGAVLGAAEVDALLGWKESVSLGEMDSSKILLSREDEYLEKICSALNRGKPANGHAIGRLGQELNIYASSGISDDHECVTEEEMVQRLRVGMKVFIREGSTERNVEGLVRAVVEHGLDTENLMFCTDDKHLDDIARDGHLRWNVRQAISLGMKPVTAIKMATWNAAREYGLRDLGAVAAGYRADLVLLDSLKQMTVRAVYKDGRPVEERFAGLAAAPVPDALLHSVHFENVAPADLALPVAGPAHVIEMVPYQIVTRHAVEEVPSENGFFRPNAVYTKLCVVERHGKNG